MDFISPTFAELLQRIQLMSKLDMGRKNDNIKLNWILEKKNSSERFCKKKKKKIVGCN